VPVSPAALATSFGTGNGVPPTSGVSIVNNLSAGGPLLDAASISAGNVQDYNSAGALCLRALVSGNSPAGLRAREGIQQVLRTANLQGKPALIVFGLNKMVEGRNSKLSYIEVTNAQHFDAFLGFPGYGARLVPLHRYFIQAMDMMYAHLKTGAPLPGSQVVRTVPRGQVGTVVNPITLANVPAIKPSPDAADSISFANNMVTVAD
jgi:hydroxybutyrate-dimer hydrolase